MKTTGTHTVRSLDQLEELAAHIAAEAKAGDVLALIGDLGSGKTTFTQALARALGVKDDVTSPTFTIVGEYEVHGRADLPAGQAGIDWLVHVDLYRIPEDGRGLDQSYIEDILQTAKAHRRVVVIEWADRFPDLTQEAAWRITFTHGTSETERILTVE